MSGDLRLSVPAASQAVLVGVHTYEHKEQLADIPGVANNLTAFKDTLTDERIWGLPEDNVTLLPQPRTTSEVVDAAVDAVAKANDTVLFYYAGHGLRDGTATPELYLALPSTRKARPEIGGYRRDTACRYEDVAHELRRPASAVRRIVIILDCCFSGRAIPTMAAGLELADRASEPLGDRLPAGRTFCVLTASAATETALAPSGAYTAFTDALLSCLNSGIPGGPALLDMGTIYEQVRTDVLSRPPTPDGALPGTPAFGSRGTPGQVCIARNVAAAPPTTDPESDPSQVQTPAGPRPAGSVPARMETLVRAYLEKVKAGQLHRAARNGERESRTLRRARPTHALDDSEEIIAVWAWRTAVWGQQDNLAFTTRGVRIADRSYRINIPYRDIAQSDFFVDEKTEWDSASEVGGYVTRYRLLIHAPKVRWSSPPSGGSPAAVKEWLEHVKRLAAG